jgi:hypothetical protein
MPPALALLFSIGLPFRSRLCSCREEHQLSTEFEEVALMHKPPNQTCMDDFDIRTGVAVVLSISFFDWLAIVGVQDKNGRERGLTTPGRKQRASGAPFSMHSRRRRGCSGIRRPNEIVLLLF